MRPTYFPALVLACLSSTVLTVRIGRGLAKPVDPVSSVSSLMYRHSGYVDQRVRQDAYTILNHESWHQRNVVSESPSSSLGPSNITSDSISEDEASILPASSPMNPSTNASMSTNETRNTDIPELLQPTTALQMAGQSDDEWNDTTNAACMSATARLEGMGNPAGLNACYNVRSLNDITGTFEADLRLYQTASPSGNWTRLETASEALDVAYTTAEIMKSSGMQKRTYPRIDKKDGWEGRRKMHHAKRAYHVQPRMLHGLTLLGTIQGDSSIEMMDV